MVLTNLIKDCLLAVVIICIFLGLFALTFAFNDVSLSHTSAEVEMPHNEAAVFSSRSAPINTKIATTKIPETMSTMPSVVQSKKKNKVGETENVAPKKDKKREVQPSVKIEKINLEIATPPQTTTDESAFRTELVSLIQKKTNEFRKKHDLPPLGYSTILESNAKKYSFSLLARGILSHTDKNNCDMSCRFAKDNYKANSLGENLAMLTFQELPTVTEVATYFMREWEKSSGHRANLLSPSFTTQGIGVSIDDESVYVAVHFSSSL